MIMMHKYTNGVNESTRVLDLVGDNVVIDMKRIFQNYYTHEDRKTAFVGIELCGYEHSLPDFVNKEYISSVSSLDAFIRLLLNALKAQIFKKWNLNNVNIVMHTSGYDSRVMSWLIKELAEEHGKEWLGKVYFVCFGIENKACGDILDYEGWDAGSQIMLYNPQIDSENFCSGLFDFENAYSDLNGINPFPINFFSYMVNKAVEIINKDKEITVWSALCFNEFFWNVRYTVDSYINWYKDFYYKCLWPSVIAPIPYRFEFPILGEDVFKLFMTKSIPENLGSLRPKIVSMLDDTLSKMERTKEPWPTRNISKEIKSKLVAEYKNSFFGSMVAPDGVKFIDTAVLEDGDWWRVWSTASCVEHLLKNGKSVSFV